MPDGDARDWLDYASFAASAVAALGAVGAVWFAVWLSARDSKNRAREQAAAVTAWQGSMEPKLPQASSDTLVIANGSSAAIYDVLVSYAAAWGGAKSDEPIFTSTTWLTAVPPGNWYFKGPKNPGNAMDVRSGVLLEFADAAGVRWRRAANGKLKQKKRSEWRQQAESDNKPSNGSLTRLV